MLTQAHALVDTIYSPPCLSHWRRQRFRRAFAACGYVSCCSGIFTAYEQAAAAAPATPPLGYEHAETAAIYRDRLDHVFPSNYPGANPRVIAETVAAPLEEHINGVENMLYMPSQTTPDSALNLTASDAVRASRGQKSRQREAAKASTEAAGLAKPRFEAGASDFLTFLDAERTRLAADREFDQAKATTAISLVSVYQALAAGF
jgi:hypothetical protein